MNSECTAEEPTNDPHRTVLVVEDEVLIRAAAALKLRDLGYVVIEAVDGAEALRIVRSGIKVDLVFSDITMPGPIDGVGLARLLERDFPHTKILLTSGVVDRPDRGSIAFLEKPYSLARLETLIGDLLEE